MAELEEAGSRVVSLAEVRAWIEGRIELSGPCVALTFDDGFEDFAAYAFGEIESRGWSATVFVPTAHVGGFNDWDARTGAAARRRIMDWSTIAKLSARGVEFGSHGVWHRDLTRVRSDELEAELLESKTAIEDRTGRPVESFAAPFGATDETLERALPSHLRIAVGTVLDRAGRGSNLYNVPRIEMWYFRRPDRWRAFLRGQAEGYSRSRRWLRWARQLAGGVAIGSAARGPTDDRRVLEQHETNRRA
jgi:peptidoglycan/xylan/chitin deacetylase (PgdA/CDA1 family)